MKWSMMFMGMGKMIVELCSAAMLFSVCRYRSCKQMEEMGYHVLHFEIWIEHYTLPTFNEEVGTHVP